MLRDSIAEFDRLENKPLVYQEKTPRRSLSNWVYAIALLLMLLLIPIRLLESRALAAFTSLPTQSGDG
jgi:mxaC protein